MLKGLDPLLGPDLLHLLASMGHGDEIVIADANFPAAALARRLVRLDGVSAPDAAAAIVSVLPLDDFTPNAAFTMSPSGPHRDAAPALPEVCRAFETVLRAAGYDRGLEAIERTEFYERARAAFGVVATGERRLWGNLILKKGAVSPR